jgi:hypothetical protein
LSGEACEARLTINRRKDVKGELLWLFYDDVFSGWIPPNHMMVFRTLEETVQKSFRLSETRGKEEGTREDGTNA